MESLQRKTIFQIVTHRVSTIYKIVLRCP